MERAYGYLRVSSAKQLEETGLSRQGAKITEFSENRYDLQGLFIEWGISGTLGLADRPALQETIERCKFPDGPKVIIVENADRWGRDGIFSVMLFKDCEKHGIKVISADGGHELTANDDPTSKMLQMVLAAVAEYAKSQLVARMRIGREIKKRDSGGVEGKEGQKPYGMKFDEATHIERMRELARNSRTAAEFMDSLNYEQIPTRSGKPWSRGVAHRIKKRILSGAK